MNLFMREIILEELGKRNSSMRSNNLRKLMSKLCSSLLTINRESISLGAETLSSKRKRGNMSLSNGYSTRELLRKCL